MILFRGVEGLTCKFKPPSMFNIKNKITVITGGISGIGQAIAILFAKQGATIHVLELTEEAGFVTGCDYP
jgi:2-keto-3-deoxy-L-fuconate dehydrogenase